MATRNNKYIVTTGKGVGESAENIGVEVEAGVMTIETSGALTFWSELNRPGLNELVIGFAPGQWLHVALQQE